MKKSAILLSSSLVAFSSATQCSLSCASNQTCFATVADTMDCLQSIPFNIDWATATVDVLSECLDNYGFLQLYHNTGPPYVAQLDITKELANTLKMIDNGDFALDIDFQEHVQDFIQITQDAHTRYQKPVCYNAVFLQPFSFDLRVEEDQSIDDEPKAFLMRNLYTDQYLTMYPDSAIESIIDQEVVLLDGLEFTTAITTWGDSHETRSNSRGVRFNSVLRSYLYRSAIQYNIRPLSDLTVTMADGQSYTFPWIASYTTGLGDVDYCAAVEDSTQLSIKDKQEKFPPVNPTHHPELLDPPIPLSNDVIMKNARSDSERVVILPSNSPNYVSCFTQFTSGSDAEDAEVSKVLVMKVSSFSPSNFVAFLNDVETCLNSEYDMMVVDVMQNGGGIVCLGLRLLELLVEDFYYNHSLVWMNYDLPHSELMDKYIEVTNDARGYLDVTTGKPFADGKAWYYGRTVTQGGVKHERTNYFALDCRSFESLPRDFKPKKFLTPDRLILLTDGTCGSTCSCFTKIPQEQGKVTIVAAGGLWEESMDVSSFAGGFVANPDSMADVAKEAGEDFPSFLTNQRWQFDWAVWYSQVFPSRPAQFVSNEPDYREAFWGFPHASINPEVTTAMVSSLYDRVINSSIARLAAEQ